MKKLLIIFIVAFLLFACGELPGKYKVIYHGDGSTSGNPPTDKNEYASGEYATVLGKNTLEKQGYEFDGWNDNSGAHYNEGEEIEIKNITIFLHSVWK